MSDTKLVRGRWVIAGATDAVLDDAAVAVAGGAIAAVGPWRELRARHPEAEVLGSNRVAVLPGLINAHHHSHGVSALQNGIPDLLLESWILTQARARPGDAYLDTLLSAARLLRGGVTAVVDLRSGRGTPEAYAETLRRGLEAYDEAGLRVAYGAGLSNQSHLVAGEDQKFLATLPEEVRRLAESRLPGPDDLDEADYLAIVDEIGAGLEAHPRLALWYGPPGPQWVSDDFLLRIAERAAARGVGIQTHVTESIYEKLYGPRAYGQATVAHLRDLGVLSPRFSIAHGVWLSREEIAILAETGAAVSHNPSSNLRLRAGIAPLNALLDAGVTVGLGMDGTTLNDDEDPFTEMRLALRLARTPLLEGPAPAPAEVFALATAGGAELLGQGQRLGRLAPGYAADLVLVDLERLCWPWVAPEADPLTLLLLRAQARDVRSVLVGGEVVLDDGKPTRIDEASAARELAERMRGTPASAAGAQLVEKLLPHLEAYYRSWERPELTPYTAYNSTK